MSAAPTGRAGLRCVRGHGLSIVDARALRIDVSEGALQVHRPGRQVQVVGTVGDLTSAVWLNREQTRRALGPAPPGQWALSLGRKISRPVLGELADVLDEWHGGSVVISGRNGPALSFYVDSFTPWGGDPSHKRTASGAVDLARSLGLTLETAADADLPARREARAGLVEPQRNAQLVSLTALGLTLLAGVLAFLSMPYGESGSGLALSFAALAVIAPVLTMLVRCRRRFEHLVTSPPPSDERTVYEPPPEAIGRLTTHLQFGENDVVLVDAGGREWWLAGPAAGGVATCAVGDPQTVLLDAEGAPMLVLRTDQVAPDDAARERLTKATKSAGIDITGHYLADTSSLDLRYESAEPGLTFTEWERGRINAVVDVLVPLAGVLHLMGAVILAGSIQPWGYLAVLGSVVWLGLRIWSGLRYRLWRASVRTRASGVT